MSSGKHIDQQKHPILFEVQLPLAASHSLLKLFFPEPNKDLNFFYFEDYILIFFKKEIHMAFG